MASALSALSSQASGGLLSIPMLATLSNFIISLFLGISTHIVIKAPVFLNIPVAVARSFSAPLSGATECKVMSTYMQTYRLGDHGHHLTRSHSPLNISFPGTMGMSSGGQLKDGVSVYHLEGNSKMVCLYIIWRATQRWCVSRGGRADPDRQGAISASLNYTIFEVSQNLTISPSTRLSQGLVLWVMFQQ